MKWGSFLLLACLGIAATVVSQELPEVTAAKWVWPNDIFLPGTGFPDEAGVTLSIEGIGDTIFSSPVDVIFAYDISGSMAGFPLEIAKDAGRFFCTYLDTADCQSGLVVFNNQAALLRGLSHDHLGLIPLIDPLQGIGATALGDAINLAHAELAGPHHEEGNLQVILIMSDGSSNMGVDPVVAAQNAKASGTLIYAMGIGPSVAEETLRAVVSEPDSETYWRIPSWPDPALYEKILQTLYAPPTYLAARELSVTELLDSNFNYVPGSFSVTPDTVAERTARWYVGDLDIGQNWIVTFRVTASDTGLYPVERIPPSSVNYMNFAGGWINVPFPQKYIHVKMGVGVEEGPVLIGGKANIFGLGPNPFHESCIISYSADGRSLVRVTVHDLAGRLTKTLVNEVRTAGMHSVLWRGDNNEGRQVASGGYVCRYESSDTIRSTIVLYLK